MRRLALALGILLIAISASAQDTATVRLYRFSFTGTNYHASKVFMDGAELARIKGGRYLDLSVPAGKHEFHSEYKSQRLVLDLEPGTRYYLRARFADGGAFSGVDLIKVEADTALAETAKLKLQK